MGSEVSKSGGARVSDDQQKALALANVLNHCINIRKEITGHDEVTDKLFELQHAALEADPTIARDAKDQLHEANDERYASKLMMDIDEELVDIKSEVKMILKAKRADEINSILE